MLLQVISIYMYYVLLKDIAVLCYNEHKRYSKLHVTYKTCYYWMSSTLNNTYQQ